MNIITSVATIEALTLETTSSEQKLKGEPSDVDISTVLPFQLFNRFVLAKVYLI